MDDDEHPVRKSRSNHNTHRSLRQLVAVEAWFVESEAKRFTLHANVTFDEERLGGGSEPNVTFKLAVRRCEVVFLPPSSGYFEVDSSTVRSSKPLNPHTVQSTKSYSKKLGAGIDVAASASEATASGLLNASAGREEATTISSTQQQNAFHELSKRSYDGNRAWKLDGSSQPNQRLWGSAWDPHAEPRVTIVDRRPETVAQNDDQTGFPPFSRIEVRCLREDIDIYDIQLKDAGKMRALLKRPGQQARMKAAEAFLKSQILLEGLHVGDLSDRYSELTICDATIPITDKRAGDG